jgi:hypothetical protein
MKDRDAPEKDARRHLFAYSALAIYRSWTDHDLRVIYEYQADALGIGAVGPKERRESTSLPGPSAEALSCERESQSPLFVHACGT